MYSNSIVIGIMYIYFLCDELEQLKDLFLFQTSIYCPLITSVFYCRAPYCWNLIVKIILGSADLTSEQSFKFGIHNSKILFNISNKFKFIYNEIFLIDS